MQLWLVRHAEPLGGQGLCYGRLDLPADAAATEQAACSVLEALGTGGAGALRSSPLQRARQLAQALAPGLGLEVAEDPRLQEMDFGHWEGVPWPQVPKAAVDAWTEDFAHHAFGGGETTQQVLDRVWQALGDARAGSGTQVWVTHAGVIRAVQHLLREGRPQIHSAAQWPRQAPAWGGWVVVDL